MSGVLRRDGTEGRQRMTLLASSGVMPYMNGGRGG
jgi:hypothetical protein